YLPSYLQGTIKMESGTVSVIITLVMAFMIPLALMFGRLADKVGEKKVFLIGLIRLTLTSVFAFSLMQLEHIAFIVIGVFSFCFLLSTYDATGPGSLPTLFYTHIRYRR